MSTLHRVIDHDPVIDHAYYMHRLRSCFTSFYYNHSFTVMKLFFVICQLYNTWLQ